MRRPLSHYLLRSVRGRLTLLVGALIIPVVVLTGTLIAQAYRNERAAVAQTLLSTVRAVSRVLESEVEKADVLLQTLTAGNAIRRGDFEAVETAARRMVSGDDRWLVVVDLQGRQLLNTRAAPGASLPQVQFEPQLLERMRRGELYISNLRESLTTRAPVIHISRPFHQDGELKYILTISFTPDQLDRMLDLQRYAAEYIIAIVDRNGIIVARSRTPDRFVGGSATVDMVEALRNRHEGVVDSTTLEGIPVLTAFRKNHHGWATLIGAPKTELYVSARRLLALGTVAGVLLIVVAFGMVTWIGRSVVRGVDDLAIAAERLGRGAPLEQQSTGLSETDFVAETMRATSTALLQRTRTLEVLNRINAALVAERDIGKIIGSVTQAGCELTGATFGLFVYHSGDELGRTATLHTACGSLPPGLAETVSAGGHPLFRLEFAAGTVLRIDDVASARIMTDPSIAAAGGTSPDPADPGFRSYLGVPVRSRTGEIVGGLYLGHREPNAFARETEDTLVGLAAEAAIAMDNAKLYHALALELDAKSRTEAELRDAQERLRQHARELERKVEERTASLQDAVTQMEEFSYTVSHDLRSPLRAMSAFAEALAEEYGSRLDDTGRDYLSRIQRASRRMDLLTTDLLSYSRVVRSQVQLVPTDLESMVRGVIEHYPELHAEKADVVIQSPLLQVLAHGPSLTQCLANLLTNATKFVRPGEKPHVTVRTQQQGSRVRIWVEDRGIGIAPEFQAKLFRIFERGPNSTKYEGTGVGLAIVRKAAEKMGGSSGVESDGRTGSRFWIELQGVPGPDGVTS